ncbi:uncharacterized protein N7483_001871 [Penicillium malachiteum]|uniref:uncharacterized protein n=1 Tax=Penicillium malachiteum TaxID=1324776 RepID=UPI00254879BB|nr:uncharacterized protein N7483_001871 [Penicillium malachiteum]KAJ5736746.1 hypothetical protein N7483_001871 [Penicillium malachiteum]
MAKPSLEGLPVELKILILFQVSDGDTLKSLIFASREYYQAYLTVKHQLLSNLVKQQYQGSLDIAEALTALRSENLTYSCEREMTIALLDRWRRRDEIRASEQVSSSQIDEPQNLEETIKLLNFHKVLCFLLEDFSINAPRPPWIEPIPWAKLLPLQLTLLEKQRFLRAACRLQTLQDIFGNDIKTDVSRDPGLKHWRLNREADIEGYVNQDGEELFHSIEFPYRSFYGTMPPWEHDEMCGVLNYFTAKIKPIFDVIANDLRKLSKSTPCKYFWDILPEEERIYAANVEVESDLAEFPYQYRYMASLGPVFLYRVLHNLWIGLLSGMPFAIVNTRGWWAEPFIGSEVQCDRSEFFPLTEPADLLESPNFEEYLTTLPLLKQPTLGWKKAWLKPHTKTDTLEDSMNWQRDDENDLEWGYALWDAARLEEWKAPLLAGNEVSIRLL